MNAKSYITRLAIYTAAVVFAVLSLNFLVDPYAITNAPRVANFNEFKTDISRYTRLSKRYQPLFKAHNALILGNSRVEMGINPHHDCFEASGWNVYNLGMPGAGVRMQLNYALNVMHQQPIEKIMLGVDFTDFISSNQELGLNGVTLGEQVTGSLQYLPSGQLNPDYLKIKFVDFYKSLFSLDALISSFKTILLQSDRAIDRDERGFNPARDFAEAVRIEGPSALFEQKMGKLARSYSKKRYLRDSQGRLGQSFADLDQFLDLAAVQGTRVHLFINPFHESYRTFLKDQALMPLYLEWRQAIIALVSKRSGDNIVLWDFSEDSSYIQEKVAASGLKSGPLLWFWEPVHYREELGDLMVNSLLSKTCDTPVIFGRQLF